MFMGMLVGKAIQMGVLVPIDFARFFMNLLVQGHNTIDDLKFLDIEIYKHLMWVKNYEGDASELGLTMSYGYDSPSGE